MKAFQQAMTHEVHGFVMDGITGSQTWQALVTEALSGSSGTTGRATLAPRMSMVMAYGHGACAAAICSATTGPASEALPVLLLIRRAVTSAGAVQCSWTMSAAAPSAMAAAAAQRSAETHEASAITDSPCESNSAAR